MPEILSIVGIHIIVENACPSPALFQLRHIEHEYTACIIGRGVAVNIGINAVLDLDPSDVIFSAIAPHDNVL